MAAAKPKYTEQEQKIYKCMSEHSSDMIFDALDRENRAELRAAITYAIANKTVDGLLEFMWNYDLMEPDTFSAGDLSYDEAMAVMRVRLETLAVGYYAITPKIRAYQERQQYDLAELERRRAKYQAAAAASQPTDA